MLPSAARCHTSSENVAGPMSPAAKAARRAYDAERWVEARRSLDAVASGHTGDDAGNRELAEYLAAVASRRLGAVDDAVERFARIVSCPTHLKHGEALLWVTGMADDPRVCARVGDAIAPYSNLDGRKWSDRETPQTEHHRAQATLAAARGWYRRGAHGDALELLARIPPTSPYGEAAARCRQHVMAAMR